MWQVILGTCADIGLVFFGCGASKVWRIGENFLRWNWGLLTNRRNVNRKGSR